MPRRVFEIVLFDPPPKGERVGWIIRFLVQSPVEPAPSLPPYSRRKKPPVFSVVEYVVSLSSVSSSRILLFLLICVSHLGLAKNANEVVGCNCVVVVVCEANHNEGCIVRG